MKHFTLLLLLLITSCSGNIDYVKDRSVEKWRKQGFEVIDYEGYKFGLYGFGPYGGADVWYRLKKIPDNGLTYSGYIKRWGNELHVYGPKSVEGITPNK